MSTMDTCISSKVKIKEIIKFCSTLSCYYRPHPKDGRKYCFQFVCQFTPEGGGVPTFHLMGEVPTFLLMREGATYPG